MSKKGSAKKEIAPKSPAVDDQTWRRVLAEAPIVTADWRCQVSLLVESEPRDTNYLEMFTEAAKNEDRMVIKTIALEETIIMVKQIGTGKEITPDEKVFEVANNYMKQGNPIPEDILAMLIKHQILKLKTDDLNIKNDQKELSDGLKNESMTMMGQQDKGTKPGVSDKKFHTDLRELGEEWKDKVYVEDFPKDGPELYIALIGFRKCGLICELLKLNVPLVAVVKIETDADPLANDMDREKLSLSNSSSSHSKLSKFSPEIAIFWEDLDLAKGAVETALLYKGVAFISFEPPYKETLPEGKSVNEIIYDEMSFLLYDIQDLTRQHSHYIETMTIIDVNESATSICIEDMTVYTNMMKSVPLESTSVALILHGLVAQVASIICPNDTIEKSQPYKDDATPNPITDDDGITGKTQSKINDIFQHKKITDKICEPQSDNLKDDVKIIPWGDFIMLECHFSDHGLIDLQNIILPTLSSLPIPKLWEYLPSDEDDEANFKLILFHECMREHNISLESAARILNLMCCKKLCEEKFFYDYQLYYKTLHKRINKLRSLISPIPSDILLKSKSFTYGENPNVNLVDGSLRRVIRFASTIQYPKLISSDDYDDVIDILEKPGPLFEQELNEDRFDINDYDSFEELTYGSTLQALNKAYFNFNTSNIKYCPVTDKIIITFFNKVRNGMNEYIWQRYIPSPVCLRDFFDYVFQEEYNWIVTEENIHDASSFGKNLDATSKVDLEKSMSEEKDSIDYDKEMLLKDSLKDSGLLNPGVLQEVSGISPDNDDKEINILASTASKDILEMKRVSDVKGKEPFKFVGYNLGEDCVVTTGKSRSFLSKDGTAIYFDIYNNFGNSSYTSTRLTTSNYDLYIHSSYNSMTKKISDIKSLRFSLKCGMNLIFKKGLESSLDLGSPSEILYQPYHYLKFSWPNGLFIEPIWSQNNTLPMYIKQTLINEKNKSSTIYEELYRCYSFNGEILIYKANGDIQVLYSDSSIYVFLESGDGFTSDTRKQFKTSVDEFLNADDLSGDSLNAQTSTSDQRKVSEKLLGDLMNYDVTLSDGRYFKMRNGEVVYEDKLLVRTATDYLMGEVYSRRLDGTNTLLTKEGVLTTSFSDGSKISSYYILETEFPYTNRNSASQLKKGDSKTNKIDKRGSEKFEENSPSESVDSINFMDDAQVVSLVYVMEHPNYATVIVNNSTRSVQINLPRNIVIQIEENGVYKLDFENLSTVTLNNDELVIKDTKCFDCNTQTTTNINLVYSQEVKENLLTCEDGFNKIFTLNYSGDCFLLNKSDPSCSCWKDSTCDKNCCGRSLNRKDRRFFVLKRYCAEILHPPLIFYYGRNDI